MFYSKQLVGLDLGSYLVKVSCLHKRRRKHYLNKFGFIPIPVNTVVDGSVMNTYEMNDAIKTLFAREKLKNRFCSIGVAGHGVINRIIHVPQVGPDEFYNAIKVEAEAHIPHDINDIYFDGIKTDVFEDGKNRVILIAARKDFIADFIQVVNDASVKPMSVEIDATALCNIFDVNYPEERKNTVAVLNLGASKINIVILANGHVRFFRDIVTGGNYITEEISRRLKVSFQHAESLKSGKEVSRDSRLLDQVDNVVVDIAKSMVSEILRVFDYYTNMNPEDGVAKVFITGGTTRSHTFTQVLNSSMERPVEKLNPFKKIVVSKQVLTTKQIEDYSHISAVSLGLALRRMDES